MSAHDCDNVTLHGMGARDRDGVSISLELSSFMPRKGGTDAKQPGSARVWSPHKLMPIIPTNSIEFGATELFCGVFRINIIFH